MRLIKSKFHFIGVGGVGMSGLAELLFNMGAQVTGSDLSKNSHCDRLAQKGIQIFVGHEANNVGDADVVVYSSAVSSQNPEFVEASKRKIPVIPRAEVLAEVMRFKRGIAVGGTHGKTTTTSMIASIFIHAKMDPTVVVGGRLDLIKSTSYLGKGEWLIGEADESDGSFLKLSPEIAVITNIDDDHLDHYGNFQNLERAFFEFAGKVPFYGLAVVCGDNIAAKNVFKNFRKRILFYGFDESNDFCLRGTAGLYEVFKDQKKLGAFRLRVPGRHNALNALASLICGLEAGLSFDLCIEGLEAYQGVDRRIDFKGVSRGITVFDDYGHHPTEVKAVLAALKEQYPEKRLVVFFQPHRYTRTQLCWQGFLECFDLASEVYLTDIYSAGEATIDGVSTENLIKDLCAKNKSLHVRHLKKDLSLGEIAKNFKSGDLVITLGAGDISKLAPLLLDEIEKSS